LFINKQADVVLLIKISAPLLLVIGITEFGRRRE